MKENNSANNCSISKSEIKENIEKLANHVKSLRKIETKAECFIYFCFDSTKNIPSNCLGYRFDKYGYKAEFEIKDNTVITTVGDKVYTNPLPVKGTRRDRVKLAWIIAENLCDSFGVDINLFRELKKNTDITFDTFILLMFDEMVDDLRNRNK